MISKTFSGLYNGVSQQPPTMRLDNQCETQENAMGSLVTGLYKRPPTEHIATLGGSIATGCKVHLINRDKDEKYLLIFTGNATTPIRVFTLAGVEKTVRYGHLTDELIFTEDLTVRAYLNAVPANPFPRTDYEVTTVADYSLITNVRRNVAVDPNEVLETKNNCALIYVKIGVSGHKYTVMLNGVEFSVETDPNSAARTNNIAHELADGLDGYFDGFHAIKKGSCVLVYFDDDQDFELSVTDSYGNQALYGIKGKTTNYNYLPPGAFGDELTKLNDAAYKFTQIGTSAEWFCELAAGGDPSIEEPTYVKRDELRFTRGEMGTLEVNEWDYATPPTLGFKTVIIRLEGDADPNSIEDPLYAVYAFAKDMRVEILQNGADQNTSYYVKYEDGNWIETRAWDLHNYFDRSTMPHRLVRLEDGTFVFADIDWSERKIGDERSAPAPSFVENAINGIFFWKNRLGFLSKDNVILSRAGDFWNFWPRTAMEVLDDDPIDVNVSTNEVTVLREALQFNKNLLLRADLQQFILSGGTTLTPKNVSVDPSTRYETIPDSRSCSAGTNAYFTCANGEYLSVREYFIQPDSLVDEAADITIHLPNYIPNGTPILKSCPHADMIFCWVPEEPKSLYVYKYFWAGNNKVQSAWGRWTFASDLLGLVVLETTLYLVFRRSGATLLEKLQLPQILTEGMDFLVHLDGQVPLVGVYSNGTTTWTLPYADGSTDYAVVDSTTGLRVAPTTKISTTQITYPGNKGGVSCLVGRNYSFVWEPTTWYLKRDQDVILSGRLQLRTTAVQVRNSGYFRLVMYPYRRSPVVYEWSAKPIGRLILGTQEIWDATFRCITPGEADKVRLRLVNDSYLPSQFVSLTYEGFLAQRSRPI